jgi:hypothetical protein
MKHTHKSDKTYKKIKSTNTGKDNANYMYNKKNKNEKKKNQQI